MARRTAGIITPGNIWASNATDGVGRFAPERLITAVPPGSALVRATGWDARFNASGQTTYVFRGEDLNQRFYEIDSLIADVNEHGVLEWHASVIYAHPALVAGSDGALYRSVQGSTGVNPTTDYDRSHWAPLNWGTQQNPAYLPNPANFNNLLTPGCYIGTSANQAVFVNAPAAVETGDVAHRQVTLEVQVSPNWLSNNPVRQLLIASDGTLFVRTRNTAAVWTNWAEVGSGSSSDGTPAGTILDYAGATAPTGYLLCDGAAVSRTTYGTLFTAIGVVWGAGDGSTTFNVPDLRRRVTAGAGGAGSSELGASVGSTGGDETHTLTVAEMPRHRHGFQVVDHEYGSGQRILRRSTVNVSVTNYTTYAGSGQAHTIVQPTAVVQKIIKH